MAAVNVCLSIEQGAKFYKAFIRRVRDTNEPVDLTGFEARMHVRSRLCDSDILLKLTSLNEPDDNGSIILNAEPGKIEINIGATETALMTFRKGVYDLELFDPADPDNVIRYLAGDFRVSKNVTR